MGKRGRQGHMKKEDVKVGAIVSAKSEEELTKPFIGKVEKIYDNSALLAITHYDPADETAISDLNNKLVVNFKNLKPASASTIKNSKTATISEVKVEKLNKVKTTEKKNNKKSDKKAVKKITKKAEKKTNKKKK
jgi:uncharacterized protein YkvS